MMSTHFITGQVDGFQTSLYKWAGRWFSKKQKKILLLSVVFSWTFIRANIRKGAGKIFKRGRGKTVWPLCRGRAKTPARSKAEFFVTIVNNRKSLTVFRKNLILDVTGFLVLSLLFLLL